MTRTLLSAAIGVPIALLAMVLWFVVERSQISGRPGTGAVRLFAVTVTVVLVGIVVARFVKYA